MSALIEASELCAGYDGHPVVENLDLEVHPGEIVGILGPNGAGKTTTLLTLAGALPSISGTLSVNGEVTKAPLHKRAARGMGLVTEERSVFMRLNVRDNLRLGNCSPADAFAVFPELEPLLDRPAGLLSGGQQQMLTLARALGRDIQLLLADELSLGLAPLVVARLLTAVREAANQRDLGVVLVEQHVQQMLRVADRIYVMRRGEVVLSGETQSIADQIESVEQSYLFVD